MCDEYGDGVVFQVPWEWSKRVCNLNRDYVFKD